jgi:hypothetical protein
MVLCSTSLTKPTVPRKVLKRLRASWRNFPIRFSEKYELLLVRNIHFVATARFRAVDLLSPTLDKFGEALRALVFGLLVGLTSGESGGWLLSSLEVGEYSINDFNVIPKA